MESREYESDPGDSRLLTLRLFMLSPLLWLLSCLSKREDPNWGEGTITGDNNRLLPLAPLLLPLLLSLRIGGKTGVMDDGGSAWFKIPEAAVDDERLGRVRPL